MSTSPEGVVLGVHVLAGFAALFAGVGAFVTTKGGPRHRRFGRGYVYSMTVVAATALVLYGFERSPIRLFLALVAVFSYYFVFTGYRVLSRKRPDATPGTVDWVAVGLLTASGVGLLAMGGLATLDGATFGTVMLTFGAIGTAFGVSDVRSFRRDAAEPRAWFFEHLTRMSAGYIATVTAFSSVNFTFLPTVVRWLGPTAVGVPAIVLLVRKYEKEGPSRETAA